VTRTAVLALGLAGLALASCGTPATPPPPRATVPAVAADTGLDRMERLTLAANRCWFKSGDAAFAAYGLAPELSSFSGRPRFLLVPRGRPEARPLVVVEGRSGSGEVSVYGPLMGEPVGRRIAADVDRWSRGSSSCSIA
jgi:hypothetical protein